MEQEYHCFSIRFEFCKYAIYSWCLMSSFLLSPVIHNYYSTSLHICKWDLKQTSRIYHRLDVFHQRCLRLILQINWHDHVQNEVVLDTTRIRSLSSMITERHLRFAGHILRLPISHPVFTALNWIPLNGWWSRGRLHTTVHGGEH